MHHREASGTDAGLVTGMNERRADGTETSEVLTQDLSAYLRGRGASLVGVADLSLPSLLPPQWLPVGISIAVALSPGIVDGILHGHLDAYVAEYERVNSILSTLSANAVSRIIAAGYRAEAYPPTMIVTGPDALAAEYPHKTAATRAGLGWIGKSALLVTREYGSALRLVTVFTDAPLISGKPVESSFCGDCSRCTDSCPGMAPTGIHWNPSRIREEFWNASRCYNVCNDFSRGSRDGNERPQVCGICIAICPWTRTYLSRSGVRR